MDIKTIERDHLIRSYIAHMTNYLKLVNPNNLSDKEIENFVKNIVTIKFKDRNITNISMDSNRDADFKTTSLWEFINNTSDKIIMPSGSIYEPATKKVALVKELVINRLNLRSIVKKAMFTAKAAGDSVLAKIKHYQQATIKINVNSLPGGMGSPYNCFFDRGGYNSITSGARALIAQSYVVCEQLLGGNFALFHEEAILNHIIVNISKRPSDNAISKVIDKYNLKHITHDKLYNFFKTSIQPYKHKFNEQLIHNVVYNLSPIEVNYLYYMGNLKHIIWDNENIFRPWLHKLTDISNLHIDTTIDPKELFKIDGDLVAVLTAIYSQLLEGKQFYDLPNENVDIAYKFIAIAKHFQSMLDDIQELFNTLVYYPANIPRVNEKKDMWRTTTVASDTDSVLFTTKNWMQWMTGEVLIDSIQNQQISSIVVYWLTKAVEKVLRKFSIQLGATGDDIRRMKMKNEFKYSSFILFDIKKTYAGVITIQEGVVLPDPDPDVKGANLRGSTLPATSIDFIKNFIINDVLKVSIDKKISANRLIKQVVDFENHIRASLSSGSVEFLNVLSIKPKETYKNYLSSQYLYLMAWNDWFGKEYGELKVPVKAPVIPLQDLSKLFLMNLERDNRKLYNKLIKFKKTYGKLPNQIVINDSIETIPKDLIPIMDIRNIIARNVRPLYLTLDSLNIQVGYEKQELLLSDIYRYDS